MPYDDGTSLGKALTPARLRAMATWFREFAALASADQRRWQLDLAGYYDRLADEREAVPATANGGLGAAR